MDAACSTQADACEQTVASAMTDTFPSKCEAAKRKAAGKLASDEFRCYAKAAAKGTPLDVTCTAKVTGKFAAALTNGGACPDGGSPQMLVENSCVKPALTTDGSGTVIDVCPTTTTSSTTSTSTTSTSVTSTTSAACESTRAGARTPSVARPVRRSASANRLLLVASG